MNEKHKKSAFVDAATGDAIAKPCHRHLHVCWWTHGSVENHSKDLNPSDKAGRCLLQGFKYLILKGIFIIFLFKIKAVSH